MDEKFQIRSVMLFLFRKNLSASAATKEICEVFGEGSLNVRVCQQWFAKFRSGDMSLEEKPGKGRKSLDLSNQIQEILDEDCRISCRGIGERLNVSHTTISNHLKAMGKVSKLGKWVPHELSETNLQTRISICNSLLSRYEIEPFLKQIITCDEKWVFYDNAVNKRQWLDANEAPEHIAKRDIHGDKRLLCIWWDYKGPVHYELLGRNQTITAELYCQQIDRLHEQLKKKRPALLNRGKLIYQQDNARPHTAKLTRQKFLDLKWEILPHPPYSPDLAPSDYHLFRSLDSFLKGKKLIEIKTYIW
jgi:histone-lysine N-methyltransferase SETMAR